MSGRARAIADRVERFVRDQIVPFERDPRNGGHGPGEDLVREMRRLAREAGVLTPHVLEDGSQLSQRETAKVLIASGLSPLGPVACNTASPDEGNMHLLGKVATVAQKARFLDPLLSGEARSAFLMTEPWEDGGAGSDPSMLRTTCRRDGDAWIVDGRKTFATGFDGAAMCLLVATSGEGPCMFLVELPDQAIRIERILNTIDGSMPGGHAVVAIRGLRVPADRMLGGAGEGLVQAQARLAPARLSHCMRWLGACRRADEIALDHACRRKAFGKPLIDHEGVGFMLADNLIDLRQAELMIDWCAGVLDEGGPGTVESSMTKVAVSEALMRVADRCVQALGGTGVTRDTIVEQVFREIRAFRIYDGPSEVHRWSLAKRRARGWRDAHA